MFSQFDNVEVEDYFNHLNAQLKQMPPADRAELHQEVRQHLEALAAAHEQAGTTPAEAAKAALSQFGDPAEVGKRMMREWRLTVNRTRASLWRLIFFVGMPQGTLTSLLIILGLPGAHFVWAWWLTLSSEVWLPNNAPSPVFTTLWFSAQNLLLVSVPIIAGITIGVRKPPRVRPEQAIPVAFYAGLIAWSVMLMIFSLYDTSVLHRHVQMYNLFNFYQADLLKSVLLACLAAYAAGLYAQSDRHRLRLADWTLRLG